MSDDDNNIHIRITFSDGGKRELTLSSWLIPLGIIMVWKRREITPFIKKTMKLWQSRQLKNDRIDMMQFYKQNKFWSNKYD